MLVQALQRLAEYLIKSEREVKNIHPWHSSIYWVFRASVLVCSCSTMTFGCLVMLKSVDVITAEETTGSAHVTEETTAEE